MARKRATINIYLTNKVVGPSGFFKFVVHDVFLCCLCMMFFMFIVEDYYFSLLVKLLSEFSERGEGRLAPGKRGRNHWFNKLFWVYIVIFIFIHLYLCIYIYTFIFIFHIYIYK